MNAENVKLIKRAEQTIDIMKALSLPECAGTFREVLDAFKASLANEDRLRSEARTCLTSRFGDATDEGKRDEPENQAVCAEG